MPGIRKYTKFLGLLLLSSEDDGNCDDDDDDDDDECKCVKLLSHRKVRFHFKTNGFV